MPTYQKPNTSLARELIEAADFDQAAWRRGAEEEHRQQDALDAQKLPWEQDADSWISREVRRVALEKGLSPAEVRSMGAHRSFEQMLRNGLSHVTRTGKRFHPSAQGFLPNGKIPRGYTLRDGFYIREAETGETMDDGDLPLGAPDPGDAPQEVTLRIKGEGAARLREFLTGVAKLCNQGSSRRIVVVDNKQEPDPDSDGLYWDFDGDGNTKLEVVGKDE